MKVKELLKKYPKHNVIMMGYPGCIPYTCLPDELRFLTGKQFLKVAKEMEVKGYKVDDKPFTSIDITHCVTGGKKQPNTYYAGTLEIYLKGNKK